MGALVIVRVSRRLQFNKLRFYLYDNMPDEFTGLIGKVNPMLGPSILIRACEKLQSRDRVEISYANARNSLGIIADYNNTDAREY